MWIYFGCCELSLFEEQTFSLLQLLALCHSFFPELEKRKIKKDEEGEQEEICLGSWHVDISQLKQIIISTQCTMLSQRIIASNWILPPFAANPNLSFPTYVCECVYVQGLCRTCALYLVKGPGGQLQLPDIPKTKIRSETYIKINLITIS